MTRRPRAFTLVEVMVVVLVLAILASVAVPSLVGATAPLARPIADLIETDLRLGRLEALRSSEATILVVGEDRASWWLQPDGEPSRELALPATLRVFGSGTLDPYGGHRLVIALEGGDAPEGDVVVARFDPEGTRDESTIDFTLVSPLGEAELGVWRLEPRRTRLRDQE